MIQMIQMVRVPQTVELSESDVITLAEAARISGRSIAVISGMLDRGTLPWYEYTPAMPGRSGARYTSRAAVLALAQRKPAQKRRRARKAKA